MIKSRLFQIAVFSISTFLPLVWTPPASASNGAICRLLAAPSHEDVSFFQVPKDLDATKNDQPLKLDFGRLSNENDLFLLRGSLRRGGGIVGVGADQVLTLAAMSKAEAVWVYDMDSNAIMLGQRLSEASKRYATLDAFLVGLKKEYLQLDPGFVDFITKIGDRRDDTGNRFGILGDPSNYLWFRELALRDRIRFVYGNHFDPGLFAAIGAEAQKLGIKINNLYLSNALESRWMRKHEADEPGGISFALSYASGSEPMFLSIRDQITRAIADRNQAQIDSETLAMGYIEMFQMHFMNLLQGKVGFIQMWPTFRKNLKGLHPTRDMRVLVSSVEHDEIMRFNNHRHVVIDTRETRGVGDDQGKLVRWTYAFAPIGLYLALKEKRMTLNLADRFQEELESSDRLLDGWIAQSKSPTIRNTLQELSKQIKSALVSMANAPKSPAEN